MRLPPAVPLDDAQLDELNHWMNERTACDFNAGYELGLKHGFRRHVMYAIDVIIGLGFAGVWYWAVC